MKRSYLLGGVFLFLKDQGRLPDSGFLLSAGLGWIIGAAVLLLVAALIASAAEIGERGLGYLSSAVSFFAALTAGLFAVQRRSCARMPILLITASSLVIALLTVGFIIRGEEMDASAILSVVSFTCAGVAAGIFIRPGRNRKKHRFSKLT